MNDIIGKKFGRLTVIKKDKTKTYNFLCVCVCDNNKISSVRIYALLNGHTKSCGCLTREIRGNLSKKHGETKHILYKYWSSMRRRCNNKNTLDYPFYGGRGIIHDPRWNDFLEFKKDMYFKYIHAKKVYRKEITEKNYLTLERKDSNNNYTFVNCVFIPKNLQGKNTRRNKWFIAFSPNGKKYKSKNQSDFSKEHKLNRKSLNNCLLGKYKQHKGWVFRYLTEEDILEKFKNERNEPNN